MIRRIKKIAIIVGICLLLLAGLNFGIKKFSEVKAENKTLQQEALKNRECKNIFKFDCPKKGGNCKLKYDSSLYQCTKEGRVVFTIVKVLNVAIIIAGLTLIIITIFKNKIL